MGIFSNILDNSASSLMQFTQEEAFMGILLAAISADGYITQDESDDFFAFTNKLKFLKKLNNTEFWDVIDKIQKFIKTEGIEKVVAACAQTLPAELKVPAFAQACDLLFSDGYVEVAEEKLLEILKAELAIPDNMATKIAEVMVVKNKI